MLLLVVCLGIVLYLDVVVMVLLDLFLEICLCKGFFWSFSGLLASCVSERSCWNILRSHKASSLTLCIVCCSSGSFRWSLFLCLASFDSSDLSCSCSTFCCLVSSQCTSSFFSWSAYEASISTSKAFSKASLTCSFLSLADESRSLRLWIWTSSPVHRFQLWRLTSFCWLLFFCFSSFCLRSSTF